MSIRSRFNYVIAGAIKILQQINYEEPNMDSVFEEHFFSEFYYLYPNVSSTTFSAKTNIPQTKIDQFTMKKYGLDFFQLCNKFRIDYFLSKKSAVISENNFFIFPLKGTGFTNRDEFNSALNLYAPISLN